MMNTYSLSLPPTPLTAPFDLNQDGVTEYFSSDGLVVERFIQPRYGLYFTDTCVVNYADTTGWRVLERGVDWAPMEFMQQDTLKYGASVHAGVWLMNPNLNGDISLQYVPVNGPTQVDYWNLTDALDEASWATQVDWNNAPHPDAFQPTPGHLHDAKDVYGLEYVTNETTGIATVIRVVESGNGSDVVGYYLDAKRSQLAQTLGTTPLQTVDLVALSADYSDSLIQTVLQSDTVQQSVLTEIASKLTALQTKLSTYRKDYYGALRSKVLIQLLLAQVGYDLSLLPVPKYLPGLVSWLDFTDSAGPAGPAPRTVTVQDKAAPRSFTGGNLLVQQSRRTGRNAVVLVGNKQLTAVSGTPVRIGAGHTVIVVTANDLTNNIPEKLTFYSNGVNESLTMDIAAGVQLKQNSAYGAWVVPAAIRDNRRAHLACACIDTVSTNSYLRTNVQSAYAVAKGDFAASVRSLTQSVEYGVIGGNNQNGAICEIMVYDRALSRFEMDAINAYMMQKYSLQFNLMANGNFTEGLVGFSTDYTPSSWLKAQQQIAIGNHYAAILDKTLYTQFFVAPNYLLFQKQMQKDNTFLVVWTSPDASKAFYRYQIKLQPGVRYRLAISIFYNPAAAPQLQLKLNSAQVGDVALLDLSEAKAEGVQWWFTPTAEDNVLELFNLNTTADINTFAVDDVYLYRDSEAIQITHDLISTLE
jgi:hypothetical protein